ncbi:hypothetical protein KDW63_09480 [Burkholderia cenocepacia]|uniref:hypothetical protein n=1 Tax=Burkholderia cenocepacia TaxID=95486 RepID=UPI001B98AD51|nr:hypothetical protein [Burkholderia cenocepacia]MBR8294412.1 hypothetical protein [Burkholderia cenocepacia]
MRDLEGVIDALPCDVRQAVPAAAVVFQLIVSRSRPVSVRFEGAIIERTRSRGESGNHRRSVMRDAVDFA